MPREKNRDARAALVKERLTQVLDDTFCGDKNLMAFCAGTDRNTLDAWLAGRRMPQKLFELSEATRIEEQWLVGRKSMRCRTPKEYWADFPWQQQGDPFRKEVLLKRELIKVRREKERIWKNRRENLEK